MPHHHPRSGRFAASTHALMERFSASVGHDRRLYRQDIAGSLAHARMLTRVGVLTPTDCAAIEAGLASIQADIEAGRLAWSDALEDVHMNIEAALTERIGDAGKRLHTGRSRNDQVATDLRLFLREQIDAICGQLTRLQLELVSLAHAQHATVMPGYTHMQGAQPVTFGHHLLAWNEMFERDFERLTECRARVNICPLGSAALAGTGFPIDRYMTAAELGFSAPSRNSLDAVSDRDFAIEFNAAAGLIMVHLSRISEELVLWSSEVFGFVELGEDFCTGSSIMPQKKNPDMAELVRGKSARVIGNLTALLTLMKSQPLAYNRDNQEDKSAVFDSVDTVTLCLQVYTAMLPGLKVNRERMHAAAARGHATATDLADYLVRKGVPFRDAHAAVGAAVRFAVEKKRELAAIELTALQQFCPAIEADVYTVLTPEGSVNSRDHIGGTAPRQVKAAARKMQRRLQRRAAKFDD